MLKYWQEIEDEKLRVYWVKTYEYWQNMVWEFAKNNNLGMSMSTKELNANDGYLLEFEQNTLLEKLESHQSIPMFEKQLEQLSQYSKNYSHLETHLSIHLITSENEKIKNVETQVQYKLVKKEKKK